MERLLFLLFLFALNTAVAQFRIEGNVVNAANEPILNVCVKFGDVITYTDRSGYFFVQSKQDHAELVFSHLIYLEKRVKVEKGVVRDTLQ